MKHGTFFLAAMLLAGPALAESPFQRGDARERRYVNSLNGFSLRLPEGASFVPPQTDNGQRAYMAQWVKPSEDNARSMLWMLMIQQLAVEKPLPVDDPTKEQYRDILLPMVLAQPGCTVEDTSYITVSGRTGIVFSGTQAAKTAYGQSDTRRLFRQVWILRDPGDFLLVQIIGSPKAKTELEADWAYVLENIKLFDPTQAIEEQKANTQRAQKLLWQHLGTDGTSNRLAQALRFKPRWYLLQQDGTTIGWVRNRGRPTRRENVLGYEIVTEGVLRRKDAQPQLVAQRCFVDPDLATEFWTTKMQLGQGSQGPVAVEEGIRQKNIIVCSMTQSQQDAVRKRTIPNAAKDIYLPKALGPVLPKLVDLRVTEAYTFAEYSSAGNDFRMRTFRVHGPETITIAGRTRQTVRCSDQPSMHEEANELWVDEQGQLLKLQAPDGLTWIVASEAEVLRFDPQAAQMLGLARPSGSRP